MNRVQKASFAGNKMHYFNHGDPDADFIKGDHLVCACGNWASQKYCTDLIEAVTCNKCKRTKAYQTRLYMMKVLKR
ncbi:MAG: hypothetical protein ACOC80_13580 [Petrotogales bacterium]